MDTNEFRVQELIAIALTLFSAVVTIAGQFLPMG